MNELAFIKQKFGDRDFIEITDVIGKKVFDWLIGGNPDQADVNQVIIRLGERGFIKFLNKGVIVSKHERGLNYSIYPFEYTDYGTCIISIYISDPAAMKGAAFPEDDINRRGNIPSEGAFPLSMLCKVEVGIDTGWKILDGTMNKELIERHIGMEIHLMQHNLSALTHLIPYVKKSRPDLKPNTTEFEAELAKQYLDSIIKAQVIKVLGTNVYLSLLEKEILISRIRQERIMRPSDKKRKNVRNVAYRYIVTLPQNYQPRKFDLNYVVSEWSRSGHLATRWVRKENADKYIERGAGYSLTTLTRGDYVALRVPISPQTCHRKNFAGNNELAKTFKA